MKVEAKLCYTDTESFVIHIITYDFYENIAGDVERWFDTSNYDENEYNSIEKRPLPIGKKKVIGLFKDELGGKIMKEFSALRTKTYAYLMDDDSEKKQAKEIKKCITKRRLMFGNYADCFFNDKIIVKSQQGLISDHHDVYNKEINKIALISNDDKRLQTFDKITTYTNGPYALKVCEIEIMIVRKLFAENYADLKVYTEQVNKITQSSNDDKRLQNILTEHIHS